MMKFGVLDVAMPTPTEIIFETGLWIPLLIMLLITGGLIALFIRNNRNKKTLEKMNKEYQNEIDK